jgi:hypothetical protein
MVVLSDASGNIVTANGTSFSSPLWWNGGLLMASIPIKKQRN